MSHDSSYLKASRLSHSISMIIFMVLASTLVGYYLMTISIDLNITANKLKFYSALLMGLVMGMIECVSISIFMRPKNKSAIVIIFISLLILAALVRRAIRKQVGITAREYLLSMIEHHQMAIDMSKRLLSSVPENVRELAQNIINSQEREIDEMRGMIKTSA